MFAQFEEGDLLSESCNDMKIGNKSDEDSALLPLISEAEIDAMSSGNTSDAEPMSTDMLKYILDRSQSYPSINRREVRYKICDFIKQRQSGWKRELLSTQNKGKFSHKVFKAVFNKHSEALPVLGESGSDVSYLIPEPRKVSEVTILSKAIINYC